MTHPAYEIIGADRRSRWLVTCDHACNHVPPWVNGGTLGLPDADMDRHIAYDVGAYGVARRLGEQLGAPVIASRFSRLVIDPNRGEDDPTLLMKLYDGTVIPGNRHAGAADLGLRMDRLYRPYHAALETLAARQADTIILAVHSFTPQLRGRPRRPWQLGVLYSYDQRLSDPLIAGLQSDPALLTLAETTANERLAIGANEPYLGHLDGDSIDRHALRHGRLNALIEWRNDLIGTPDQQITWAHAVLPALQAALHAADSHKG